MVHSLVAMQLVGHHVDLGIDSADSAADLLDVTDQLIEAFSVGSSVVLVLISVLAAQLDDLHDQRRDRAADNADASQDGDPLSSSPAGSV